MPIRRIFESLNAFIKHAESGQLKEAAKAINEANSAYREIDQKPEGRKKTKEIMGKIYEKLKGGNRVDAIVEAVEFRGKFEGALQMQEQMESQIQAMKNAGIDPVQMANNMPPFQVLVGSLCYRFWKPEIPTTPLNRAFFGMMEALEEGLRGDTDGNTVEEVLESVKNYENDYYVSPEMIFGDLEIFLPNFPLLCKVREIKNTKKEYFLSFIHWDLGNKIKQSGAVLDLENSDCFEGLVAIALELGLKIRRLDPRLAKTLTNEVRSPTHLPGAETPQATSQSASIKLKELKGGQLIQLLDYPEDYETLSDEDLDLFVHGTIFLYGRDKKAELISKIRTLYKLFCQRIPGTQRLKNYFATRDDVLSNKINLMALMPYLCEDDDLGVVSTAALDYAVIYTSDNDDLLTGPKEILEMFDNGYFSNPAAALGGLVMLGDQRVMDLIRSTREHLDEEQVSILTKCQTGFLNAATVEFYLSWLEDLKGNYNDAIFGLVAVALHNMVKNPSAPFVTSIERIFPATMNDNPIKLLQKWSIPQFAKNLLPRFQAIAKREKDPKVMPMVMQAWGL